MLGSRPGKALFLTELQAGLSDTSNDEISGAVRELAVRQLLLVVDHQSPDPHITGDLRVVALLDAHDADQAHQRAELVWARWLREFLTHHRCG